ncbi:hypothetical protein NBRC116601_09660 [Cognatishimia sp. WU-CL00825]
MLKLVTALTLFALSSIARAAGTSENQDVVIHPAHADYAELANLWTQWSFSFPDKLRPQKSRWGLACNLNQSGNVWFLSNSDQSKPVNRTCEIPTGKSLFFPILENIVFNPPNLNLTCDDVQDTA